MKTISCPELTLHTGETDCRMPTMVPGMTPANRARWERYRIGGDLEARSELLEQYIGLVHHVARQMMPGLAGKVELDDLISAGTLGLVTALGSFELERGLAFSTYATPRIRGAMLDELRSRDWMPRSLRMKNRRIRAMTHQLEGLLGYPPEAQHIAAALGIDVDTYWKWQDAIECSSLVSFDAPVSAEDGDEVAREELLGDPACVEPTEDLLFEEEIVAVQHAISELSPKERTVLALYYYEELTLRKIAEIMQLTESRISQIRTQALKRLRKKLVVPAVA